MSGWVEHKWSLSTKQVSVELRVKERKLYLDSQEKHGGTGACGLWEDHIIDHIRQDPQNLRVSYRLKGAGS